MKNQKSTSNLLLRMRMWFGFCYVVFILWIFKHHISHHISMNSIVVVVVNAQQYNNNAINNMKNTTPEGLFRHTYTKWIQSMEQQQTSPTNNNPWQIWNEFATTLQDMFHDASKMKPTSTIIIQQKHLDTIGAIEESILTIERYIVEQEQEQIMEQQFTEPNNNADNVLSNLYTVYATLLLELTSIECWKLASDSHTLLIGAPERIRQYNQEILLSNNDNNNVDDDDDELYLLDKLFGPLCFDNADNAIRNAMTIDATNQRAIQLLENIITGNKNDNPSHIHRRKSKEFMAELFDSYADVFDDKLLKDLQYRVPKLINETLASIIGRQSDDDDDDDDDDIINNNIHKGKNDATTKLFHNVLDAGCGTGLIGRQIRPYMMMDDGTLVGVDASTKMLDIAKLCTRSIGCGSNDANAVNDDDDDDQRPLYDILLEMDLEDMTINNTLLSQSSSQEIEQPQQDKYDDKNNNHAQYFDLIVAGDVIVYFGSLENIIKVFSTLSSKSNSWLIFTCELATEEEAPLGFRLLSSGRFAHTKNYVIEIANILGGYSLYSYQEIVPRIEKGQPVRGHLFVFNKEKATPDEEDNNANNEKISESNAVAQEL